jgi:hypothetical protein
LKVVWSNAIVMRWRMMLSEIIAHIGVTRRPTYIELVLFNSVFDPVEYHVNCVGALLLDCVIDDAICCVVFSFEFCGIVFVAHFRKCCATVPSFAFTKTAPNSASVIEDTICLSTVVWQRSGPLVRVFVDEFVLLPR